MLAPCLCIICARLGANSGNDLKHATDMAKTAFSAITETIQEIRRNISTLLALVPTSSLAAGTTRPCVLKIQALEPFGTRLEAMLWSPEGVGEAEIRKTLLEAAPKVQRVA